MFAGLSIAYARHSIDYGMMFEKNYIEYYLNKYNFNTIFELILIIYNLYPNEVFNYANKYNNFSYKNKYIIYINPKNILIIYINLLRHIKYYLLNFNVIIFTI
ncbi:unknown similar to AMEV030 [Mythimna separata entomopoxvirus 'L']|uniref:Uncharacterized protein n=1 Tax=Mythimna separata entomopoxvirus 'L' TaxID=1293572 RepID=A0A916KQ02_9POXV|nr:unknown similar to AMEV030 [Mythimna separata entomopoxvirus 'L']CCU56249.1 unknown similar to AMEV030 [Mythimna separata entomopoxvirus 'L']